MDKKRILVVEDEFVTGLEIQARLSDAGYDVPVVVDNGDEAIAKTAEIHPDVVMMDIVLKGEMNGIEAARRIREQFGIPVIYLTAHSDSATIDQAVTTEPFGYLIKPLDERALITAIRMALYKHAMDQALAGSERRYRAIAELAEDAILICSRDRIVTFINTAGGRFFHVNPDEIAGKSIPGLIPGKLSDHLCTLIDSVFSSKNSSRETLAGMLDDSMVWFDTTVIPVDSEDGTVIEVICHLNNVTRMVLLEQEIEKKGIIQIEQNMEQFQILNDKIRNPLSIIISLASLEEKEENRLIIEQAKKIDDMVAQLDKGWIRSDSIRAFLLKHYGHGKELS
ncbi:MAG: response regulator [Methanospirillaceae archaeon]|nr:response regulator [Methanospirillaceae archaeon]